MDLVAFDPGLSGAACFMKDGLAVEIIDMPTLADGSNRQVDVMALCRRIDRWKPRYAVIENVQPMPSIPGADGLRRGMGAASSFRFGFAVGQIRATAVCYGINVRLVHAVSWKRHFGLKAEPGDRADQIKERSRLLALELMPSIAPQIGRKKDHNKAESVLLAIYGRDTLGML